MLKVSRISPLRTNAGFALTALALIALFGLASCTDEGRPSCSGADCEPYDQGVGLVDGRVADGRPIADQRLDGALPFFDGAQPDAVVADARLVDSGGDAPVDTRPTPPPCTPQQELCNGLDDDCDGVVDNGLTGCDSCAVHSHELPLVTHWKNGVGVQFLAADPIDLYQAYTPGAAYDPSGCHYAYKQNILPDHESYPGDVYSVVRFADATVVDSFTEICRLVGMPLRLFRSDGISRLQAKPGLVQILHGVPIDGSLATVILPPNWSPAAAVASYPIVFNGFYDLNQNLVQQEGVHLLKAIALSGQDGRSGAIGVLWNGGGALASRTMNRRAYDQFAAVIAYVARHFAGDARRILMWGGSRGGYTTVAMASNPFGHDYRVIFAAPGVPPARVGEHGQLQSSTYPGVLHAASWSTGLHDAWRPDFSYPACANRPHLTGKTGPEAHLHVIAGSTDFDLVNTTLSPLAPTFIAGLKAAGTEVYLEIASHDNIVPYVHQLRYARRLIAEQIPVHVDVLIRAGHAHRSETSAYGTYPVRFGRLWEALVPQIDSAAAPYHVTPGIDFYRVDRQSQALQSFSPSGVAYPFTVEFPYRTARGFPFPVVFVGEAQTRYTFSILDGQQTALYTTTGTIPASMGDIVWVDVGGGFPAGTYEVRLSIQKPGQAQVEISPYNTPSGDLAVVHLEASLPNVDGAGASNWAKAPGVNGFGGTNWGLSEY